MWSTEHSETATATPARVWAQWSDVTGWPTWDEGVEWATLEGPFAVGGAGRLKPKGAPAARFVLTEVDPERGFSDETRLPLARMRFTHRLVPDGDGRVRITHAVTITGLLSPLFGRVIGRGIARQLPEAVRGLARRAQAG